MGWIGMNYRFSEGWQVRSLIRSEQYSGLIGTLVRYPCSNVLNGLKCELATVLWVYV